MDVMDQLQGYLTAILEFARQGFGEVNAALGLIVALIASFLLSGYSRILHVTIGATVVHIAVETLIPVVSGGRDFRLPAFLEPAFWEKVGVLLVGYFIVITVLYLARRLLLRR